MRFNKAQSGSFENIGGAKNGETQVFLIVPFEIHLKMKNSMKCWLKREQGDERAGKSGGKNESERKKWYKYDKSKKKKKKMKKGNRTRKYLNLLVFEKNVSGGLVRGNPVFG